jgi:hypothetical protein
MTNSLFGSGRMVSVCEVGWSLRYVTSLVRSGRRCGFPSPTTSTTRRQPRPLLHALRVVQHHPTSGGASSAAVGMPRSGREARGERNKGRVVVRTRREARGERNKGRAMVRTRREARGARSHGRVVVRRRRGAIGGRTSRGGSYAPQTSPGSWSVGDGQVTVEVGRRWEGDRLGRPAG